MRGSDPDFCWERSIRFKPFRAWRPDPQIAERVASPPYDVVDRAEAAALAHGNPFSFLHVGRSDIDLPADVSPYDDRVYDKAKSNLQAFMSDGTLIQEREPSLYLYELTMGGRAQVGIVGCVHIDDYENDLIKKHERTRKDKEDDRTRHVLTLRANAEPVFLTYEGQPYIERLNKDIMAGKPLYDFTSADGVRQRVWRVTDSSAYVDSFRRIPHFYVADGHHRCASAWRAGRERRDANPNHTGKEEYNWFLAVLFPTNQLAILPYNRAVRDLNGMTPVQFLARLPEVGRVSPAHSAVRPEKAGVIGVYVDRHWYRLEIDPETINRGGFIKSLDVEILYDRLLAPVLGIGDIRSDKRIDFVGGIRGTDELERRVDSGEMAVAFSLHPVTIEQLTTVADSGGVMPPKSTWFEPKLKSGLFVHTLD
ncbi:MAG: DUF1015 family protein [Gemmatimonadota bacterium]